MRKQIIQSAASTAAASTSGGLVRAKFNFSPTGSTFEREEWTLNAEGVTHLRLQIKPDKGGRPCRVSVTSLVLRP